MHEVEVVGVPFAILGDLVEHEQVAAVGALPEGIPEQAIDRHLAMQERVGSVGRQEWMHRAPAAFEGGTRPADLDRGGLEQPKRIGGFRWRDVAPRPEPLAQSDRQLRGELYVVDQRAVGVKHRPGDVDQGLQNIWRIVAAQNGLRQPIDGVRELESSLLGDRRRHVLGRR